MISLVVSFVPVAELDNESSHYIFEFDYIFVLLSDCVGFLSLNIFSNTWIKGRITDTGFTPIPACKRHKSNMSSM